MQTNQQLEMANKIVRHTNANLFLTGKAGTGKTTFLKSLKETTPKRMIVVAPTGVAAINAGGVTIHSFFQINFGPFIPGRTSATEINRMRKEKMNIIRTLDLLVIDEISMVRADLLDAIDDTLRRIRRSSQPFGGIQLLMIGDMQQLTPVARDDEWAILKEYYSTPYFFSSQALQQTNYTCIELKEIFRQSDTHFIELLNKVRENKIDSATLEELNKRYMPQFTPEKGTRYIRLTTHNHTAQHINESELDKLRGVPQRFVAQTTGTFPEQSYPNDKELTLKVGAQVMFIKNDSSKEKRYFNGKLGTVKSFGDGFVIVEDESNGEEISVTQEVWENIRYTINDETKEIEETIDGTFSQMPLKTAWAITIHKSQGLTFEHAIIDAQNSFSHGQVYVALSRCKTLEGMVLSTPLSFNSVKLDLRVESFSHELCNRIPDEEQYNRLRKEYYVQLLIEQFSFDKIYNSMLILQRIVCENLSHSFPKLVKLYDDNIVLFNKEIADVSKKFTSQLQNLTQAEYELSCNDQLQDRIIKGSQYFAQKIEDIVHSLVIQTQSIDIDNKELSKRIRENSNNLLLLFNEKKSTLKECHNGFSIKDYLKAKNNEVLSEKETPTLKQPKVTSVSDDILYPELYERLKQWRKEKADEQKVPAYVVLSQKALINLTNTLPKDGIELLKVNGIGEVLAKRYGEDILTIIDECVVQYDYKREASLFDNLSKEKEKKTSSGEKKPKEKTQEVTLRLFTEGKSIEEIAKERDLVQTTIEGHIVDLICEQKLPLNALTTEDRIQELLLYIQKNPGQASKEVRTALNDEYSYSEIKLAFYFDKQKRED